MPEEDQVTVTREELRELISDAIAENREEEFGLVDVVIAIRNYGKAGAIFAGCVATAVMIYFLALATPSYVAAADLLIPKDSEDGMTQESYITMLNSGEFTNSLITSLPASVKDPVVELTDTEITRALRFADEESVVTLRSSPLSDIVTISSSLPEPELAAELVNEMAAHFRRYSKERTNVILTEELEYLQEELREELEIMDDCKGQLNDYLEKHKILVPGRIISVDGFQFFSGETESSEGDAESAERAEADEFSKVSPPAKRAVESDLVYYELSDRFRRAVDRVGALEDDIDRIEALFTAPNKSVELIRNAQVPRQMASPTVKSASISIIASFIIALGGWIAFWTGLSWVREI